MNHFHFVKLLALGIGLALVACNPATSFSPVADLNPVTRFYVSGYISVPVSTTVGAASGLKQKDIALPHASVFLYNRKISPDPIASTVSDLSGRFKLKTDTPAGVNYEICVEANGFQQTCQKEVN